MPAICGARLQGFLDGTAILPPKEIEVKEEDKQVKRPNPLYTRFVALDQPLLRYLVTSPSHNVMTSVTTLETSAEVLKVLGMMFASWTQARSVNTRVALSTTWKGEMSITTTILHQNDIAWLLLPTARSSALMIV